MVFSSIIFAFAFLPITVALYYLADKKYRNSVLIVASLLFYAYGEPRFWIVMLASIFINYLLASGIEKCKKQRTRNWLLVLVLLGNIGLLFVYKYLDFTIQLLNKISGSKISYTGIVLPIGISFFTFQALSYVIDVWRGNAKAQKNLLNVVLYIAFFPQLIAGPIVRYNSIEEQIQDRETSLVKYGMGMKRFILGFCKKVILANNLAVIATDVFQVGDVTKANAIYLWLGSICFSLQIYYDFSGYSDMAIGLGKMFGFEFEENFNYPYISKTVTEFWRRWHISLGKWFKEYVYFPLGGSRKKWYRNILNMFVVWLLTGIWHGASLAFVAWGLGYLLLLIVEKYVLKIEKKNSKCLSGVWRIVTLCSINFGWVIFNSSGLKTGIKQCLAMCGFFENKFVLDDTIIFYLREYGFYIILGIIFATPVVKVLNERMTGNNIIDKTKLLIQPMCYLCVFLWAVSFLILGVHNPFIYFNF